MPTDEPAPPPQPSPLTEGQFRLLRLAVYGMGALLVVGFFVIAGRIAYLVARTPAPPAGTETPLPSAAKPDIRLPLPAAAIVRQMSLSGNRLAVHYETPAGAAIAVIDLTTGAIVSRVAIEPAR